MIIKLDDKCFIVKDSNCYTLKELTGSTDKKGKPLSKDHGYYASLENALSKFLIIRTEMSLENESTIKEYIAELKKQKNEIKELIR